MVEIVSTDVGASAQARAVLGAFGGLQGAHLEPTVCVALTSFTND